MSGFLGRTRRMAILLAGATTLALTLGASGALGEDNDFGQPIDFLHNVNQAPAPVTGTVWANGPRIPTGTAICTTPAQTGSNINTDCEGTNPHNETSIAVNPTNARNILGGANDYQLALNPGGHVGETILSRAHVSFDGGTSWSEYPVGSNSAYQATGDPSVAFDAAGHAYYATLGFRFVGPVNAQSPDILVANSGNGGRTWSEHRVAQGSGVFTSVGDVLDKEYVTAWGNGNAIVTWGDFRQGQKGAFISVKINASVTHDGGTTWSAPRVISGSLTESFVPVPTVAADGRVYVAFLNTTDNTTGRDDYEVVEVSPATGGRLAGPFKVATTIDGFTDYPIALGRQTYHDSIFRTWAAGNITADPTDPTHLAVVWSDMRNSTLPAPTDPYSASTNSDVIVSQSFDRGRNWSAPVALARAGDQFMPWGAYDRGGLLRIGLFDRHGDASNHTYGYSLSTETAAGALAFGTTTISTVRSDPTRDNRWFAATLNPGFPFATSFLGDYSNIAATPSGGVVAYWTDLRNQACFLGRCGHGEDAYFTAAP
jgi:hypothetical protein